ncbi:fimbrial protein [Burkholderia pyrrocinia]|uniref:fimbrial protein n=1 Tax=Burkholderia pyrrocinia TaxID=60550 RepID=UPI00130DD42D|nr:fimbrial protein [Burkholderia pyrrocinia]
MLLTAFESAHACQMLFWAGIIRPSVPATITSARDSGQPGTLIGPGAIANERGMSLFQCSLSGKVGKVGVKAMGTLVPNVTYDSEGKSFPVYETGVPGIGFALMAVPLSDHSVVGADWKAVRPEETLVSDRESQITYFYYVRYQAALVFTGSLATGTYTIPQRRVATTTAYAPNGAVAFSAITDLGAMTIKVTASGCTLTSGAQTNVKLPQLVGNKLKAVGAVSDESAPVTLRVNCQGAVNVYTTLTDAANPANEGTILSAHPGSTSRGVGLQIYKQGSETPLHFGPDSAVKGNTNQWLAGQVTDGSLSIPLVARYVKTAQTFTPGSLDASATFTFSYQ